MPKNIFFTLKFAEWKKTPKGRIYVTTQANMANFLYIAGLRVLAIKIAN